MPNERAHFSVVLIERLGFVSWLWSVMSVFYWRDRGQLSHIFFIDATLFGLRLARWSRAVLAIVYERHDFRLVDLHDEEGNLIRLRIAFRDLVEVKRDILAAPEFQRALHDTVPTTNWASFLAKQVIYHHSTHRQSLFRLLFLIDVAAALSRTLGQRVALKMQPVLWVDALAVYASDRGVKLLARVGILGERVSNLFRQLSALRGLRDRLRDCALARSRRRLLSEVSAAISNARSPRPRVAVDYYGQLNLDEPAFTSDLFFVRPGGVVAKDVLVTFRLPHDPLDQEKAEALARHGLHALVLDPRATTVSPVPQEFPSMMGLPIGTFAQGLFGAKRAWIASQRAYYCALVSFWSRVFLRQNIRIFVSWYRYDAAHIAIAEAMKRVGGLFVMYQRSFEEFSSPEMTTVCDVFFSFAPRFAAVERGSGSKIPYHVTTGYLGDFRFTLLRSVAERLRAGLHANGVQRIVAFFDENSLDDSRWHTGHAFMRENYEFLLRQALADPTLGVVFKPKTPPTLRRRLGPVAELLSRAEATGRCVVLEAGTISNAYPPAAAALAADVAIHGHLCAVTAGVEAALAGAPTLLLDREGFPMSSFAQSLPASRVVFRDWPTLWQACEKHFASFGGSPGFGDWTALLPMLDPFRDGRAADRMSVYLAGLLEGLAAGYPREEVLRDAAERYRAQWGCEMVQEII